MKRILSLLTAALLALGMKAQNVDSLTLSELKLNFVVPDIPAFKTLGTDPTNLLRPSTPKALAVSMSQFYNDRKVVIPKAFAMELSPALLISASKHTLRELQTYQKHAVINSLRISLGSSNDTNITTSGRSMSLGLRITPINKGDMQTDKAFLQEVSNHLHLFVLTEDSLRRQFAQANIDSVKRWAGSSDPNIHNIDNVVDWDDALYEKLRSDSLWLKKYNTFKTGIKSFDFDKWLAAEKEAYKKRNWNATKLDFAAAAMGSSPDSLVKSVRFKRADVWATLALRAGKNGQLLIGLNGTVYKDLKDTVRSTMNKDYYLLSVPLRYLLGTNRVKGFAEAQYQYGSSGKGTSSLYCNLGTELNIVDGFWLNFTGGVKSDLNTGVTSFVSSLNLKMTLPEKFKFF